MDEQYPRGKLNADDEGKMEMALTVYNGVMIVNFGKPVKWIGLDYYHAIAFAEAILERAKEIKPKDLIEQ